MTILVIILLTLSLGVTAFYIWGMRRIRKNKEKLWLYAPPFIINAMGAFSMLYMFLILASAMLHEMTIDWSGWLMLFSPLILQTIANQLIYFLYYKRKKKMTSRAYILTSVAGVLSIIIYMTYLEVSAYITLWSML